MQIEVHGGRAEVEGRPAVVGTMLDVTEREATQDRLRRAERQYRDLFEEMLKRGARPYGESYAQLLESLSPKVACTIVYPAENGVDSTVR